MNAALKLSALPPSIAEAVERIEVIESSALWRPGFCACDEDLTLPSVVYRVTTAIPYRAQTLCSVECVAYALLWDLHPTQEQSHGPLTRVTGAIERSFARRS